LQAETSDGISVKRLQNGIPEYAAMQREPRFL
jgi:hypothetical protein